MPSFAFSTGGGWEPGKSQLKKTLLTHFGVEASDVAAASRQFPIAARVDLQSAIESIVSGRPDVKLLGISSPDPHHAPGIGDVLGSVHMPIEAGPLQHDDIDIGEADPVRCLKNGVWLWREESVPVALFMSSGGRFGLWVGVQVEIAVPKGEPGAKVSQDIFRSIELLIGKGNTYRGRVISLEAQIDPRGGGSMVKVHRLAKVARENVVLPAKTIDLLERNVTGFVAARKELARMQFQSKKGLLFYGPPGTGKTHTIHYLASQLPGHTTLLVTAGQVALLGEYFRLARFLQPSMMIIEDVDLIGRERTHMHHAMEEALLNQLLNEMDGLREDAEVIFILTTNRPEEIEPALASRPGRIDQAIEFPLPDEEGRAKLIELYARGLEIPPGLSADIVSRTKGVSAAFIKELMRRCAQMQIEFGLGTVLAERSVDAALEEMLFIGGSLNRRLLGADGAGRSFTTPAAIVRADG